MQLKSYTDIEQSRKLAEILPLESADMLWGYYYNGKNHCIPNIRPFRDGRNEIPKSYIPAWSLAALLSVLPYPQLSKDKLGSGKEGWMISVYPNDCRYDSCWHDNSVDACVNMIIKLNELNLL